MALESKTQKSLLFAFIASICLCALVGIYCILLGDMGDLEGRILATTATIGGASILALAAAIPWERKRWQPVGPLGIVFIALALAQIVCLIWIDDYWRTEGLIKLLLISCTLAAAFPHVGLLSLARLQRGYEWVRIGTIACIAALAAIIIALVLAEIEDEFLFRVIGTLAILDVSGTITVPILHRVSAVGKRESIQSASLEVSLTCPRCNKTSTRPIGRSSCKDCGLTVKIEIEESHCHKCGYVLFGLQSSVCPECGEPIAKAATSTPTTAVG